MQTFGLQGLLYHTMIRNAVALSSKIIFIANVIYMLYNKIKNVTLFAKGAGVK